MLICYSKNPSICCLEGFHFNFLLLNRHESSLLSCSAYPKDAKFILDNWNPSEHLWKENAWRVDKKGGTCSSLIGKRKMQYLLKAWHKTEKLDKTTTTTTSWRNNSRTSWTENPSIDQSCTGRWLHSVHPIAIIERQKGKENVVKQSSKSARRQTRHKNRPQKSGKDDMAKITERESASKRGK